MGKRRDEYEEGYEDARREMRERELGSQRNDTSFTAAMFIKYAAIIIVVLIIAYVVLQVLWAIQGNLNPGPPR